MSRAPDRLLPLVWHRFLNLREVAQRVIFDGGEVTVTLPRPELAPASELVSLCFRVSDGPINEVIGRKVATDDALVVHFEGEQAGLIRTALQHVARVSRERKYARYACSIPVAMNAGGTAVRTIATNVGLGGARLTVLSARLEPGRKVQLCFEGQDRPVSATVAWYWARGIAGVAFVDEPETNRVVRRVTSAAAMEETSGPSIQSVLESLLR